MLSLNQGLEMSEEDGHRHKENSKTSLLFMFQAGILPCWIQAGLGVEYFTNY